MTALRQRAAPRRISPMNALKLLRRQKVAALKRRCPRPMLFFKNCSAPFAKLPATFAEKGLEGARTARRCAKAGRARIVSAGAAGLRRPLGRGVLLPPLGDAPAFFGIGRITSHNNRGCIPSLPAPTTARSSIPQLRQRRRRRDCSSRNNNGDAASNPSGGGASNGDDASSDGGASRGGDGNGGDSSHDSSGLALSAKIPQRSRGWELAWAPQKQRAQKRRAPRPRRPQGDYAYRLG